jgi:UDP-N-acetylglucosamine 2-epimerase
MIEALNKMMTVEFKEKLNSINNPYGDGHSSEKIVKILKEKLYV